MQICNNNISDVYKNEIVKILLNNGANPNISNDRHETPLLKRHLYGSCKLTETIIILLLENGAELKDPLDRSFTDYYGHDKDMKQIYDDCNYNIMH
jgi:ankyrin repeat protein